MAAEPPPYTLSVESAAAGQRLDHYLRQALPHVSRSALRALFDAGSIRVNGKPAVKAASIATGDRIEVDLDQPAGAEPVPAPDPELALRVVYEDRWLVAVDKPGGTPSHALRAGERGTVVSALLARYPELRGVGYRSLEPGLLHRLDNDTSGILLAARDQASFESLRRSHLAGTFTKRYLALCAGHVALQRAHAFLCADRRKVAVRDAPFRAARPVTTELIASQPYGSLSLVTVQLTLAARHQVRAHLAQLGHPIAGDSLYGGPSVQGLARHFLHASELELNHPVDGRRLCLRAPLADDLARVLSTLT